MKKIYNTNKGALIVSYAASHKDREIKKTASFKSKDGKTGTLETEDKDLMKYIENRPDFGTRIVLVGAQDAPKVRKEPAMEIVEAANYQAAREYLLERGYKAEEINTPAKIERAAKASGIEFKGLNG